MCQPDSRRTETLAELFLQNVRDARRPISAYLVNGFQLKGTVLEFDSETVLFQIKDACQMVMRSALASMYPLPAAGGRQEEWWCKYVPQQV